MEKISKIVRPVILSCFDGKCLCCGFNIYPCSLHLHHINPVEKLYDFNDKLYWDIEKLKTELKKCVLVCANCHGAIHAGLITIENKIYFDESKMTFISLPRIEMVQMDFNFNDKRVRHTHKYKRKYKLTAKAKSIEVEKKTVKTIINTLKGNKVKYRSPAQRIKAEKRLVRKIIKDRCFTVGSNVKLSRESKKLIASHYNSVHRTEI